jgi:shikimate kinase
MELRCRLAIADTISTTDNTSSINSEGNQGVKRILLTGLSGVGKSTVTSELAKRGYKCVDADSDEYSHWEAVVDDAGVAGTPVEPDRDWVWREDRVSDLLYSEDGDVLFVSGCAANMSQFLPRFDHVILLSAPRDAIAERLATRTTNDYGKRPDEAARVLDLIDTVEPLLRRVAHHEIDTNQPLSEVVATVLRIAQPEKDAAGIQQRH